jgi:hypothetical protein
LTLAAALFVALASPALARTPALPRELRGRVAVELESCRPVGRDDALLEAVVRVRAGETGVSLPGLHCGAFDARGRVYFLTPVAGALELAPRESRRLPVRFAADAQHRECGCSVVDVRDLAAEEPSRAFAPDAADTGDAAFDAFLARVASEDADVRSDPLPTLGVEPAPVAAPGLRFERVLAPRIALRAAPFAQADSTGAVPPGARVAVDRIERGWKHVRAADGAAGWIPGDAATADVAAPDRISEQLAPLRAALAPGADASCSTVSRESLGELVAVWRIEQRAVHLRPIWYALPRADRDAFQAWVSDCYGVVRLYDASRGEELRSAEWQAPRVP